MGTVVGFPLSEVVGIADGADVGNPFVYVGTLVDAVVVGQGEGMGVGASGRFAKDDVGAIDGSDDGCFEGASVDGTVVRILGL